MRIDYSSRIFGLDLLRAIAILGVLGSHALWVFPDASGLIAYVLKFGGVMGVEIFFVLSGFLIGRILFRLFMQDDFEMKHFSYFLVRRWFRTLPNYYVILILNMVLVMAIGRELPDTLPLYFGFLQNFKDGMDVFFTESWSLPIEEFAYILGPLILLLSAFVFRKKAVKEANGDLHGSKGKARSRLFLGVTVMILVVFLLNKVCYVNRLTDTSLDYWNIHLKAVVWYRIDAIYYGVLAAYISMAYKEQWIRNAQLIGFLGGVFFLLLQGLMSVYQLTSDRSPWLWNVFYLPIMSIIYAMFLPVLSQWKEKPRFLGKTITGVSLISYAVYLLHYGILLQTMRWLWPIETMSGLMRVAYILVYLIFVFGVSYIWYRLFEKPMMDLRDKPRIKDWFS
ncbi:MAG: peptidoglycan/LPS O-acetylase OafA/YrhL [Dokdonia sp.]|jgi:peptidoglycan/LPS O-acetylase OafA/YrhL